MWTQRFVEYLLRGRKEATLTALICTFIPFMGWLGVVIMALVILRKGPKEGVFIFFWTALPSVVLAFVGHPLPLFYGVLCGSLVVLLLATVLRETSSWRDVLQIATLLGLLGVLIAHGATKDITSHWLNFIGSYYKGAEKVLDLKLSPQDLNIVMQKMAQMATGVQACVLLLLNLINLIIARWLQALVFNPGGLAKELYNIRLSFIADVILLGVIIAIFAGISIAWDLLPLLLLLFFLAGLSLIHAAINSTQGRWSWLIGFYGLLILFFPYMASIVILLAVADSILNFRKKLQDNATSS